MLKQNWAVQCCWRLESWQVKKVPAQHARLTLVESSNRGRDPQAAGVVLLGLLCTGVWRSQPKVLDKRAVSAGIRNQ